MLTSPTTENGWLSRAINSIILALMDFVFELSRWNVLTLSNDCSTCWLLDPHSRHCGLGMLCCMSNATSTTSLRHLPTLYRHAHQLWHRFCTSGWKKTFGRYRCWHFYLISYDSDMFTDILCIPNNNTTWDFIVLFNKPKSHYNCRNEKKTKKTVKTKHQTEQNHE